METKYKSIDLFAGIGGIRLGFAMTGRVENVFGSDINPYAAKTYQENFADNPLCDITQIDAESIPDFDILLAGFPCQAFSIAGKKGGFDDTRGTLFFDVARIIKAKQPQAFLLENVKGLLMHKKGETLKTILNVLDQLGYMVKYKVLNSKDYGVPQNRERIYIVGFKHGNAEFEFPQTSARTKLNDILEKTPVSPKYYLSQRYFNTLQEHKKRHGEKGNGYGYIILNPEGVANAIVVGGMGRERNLLIDEKVKLHPEYQKYPKDINKQFVRTLTPREWARLQGYPDDYKFPVSDTQAYKQLGNSVSVPVIHALANRVVAILDNSASQIPIKKAANA